MFEYIICMCMYVYGVYLLLKKNSKKLENIIN